MRADFFGEAIHVGPKRFQFLRRTLNWPCRNQPSHNFAAMSDFDYLALFAHATDDLASIGFQLTDAY